MKKILSFLFIIAFLFVGTLSMFACGTKYTGEDVYNLIKTQMELMLEEGTPFKSGTSNGVSSNYLLDNFYKKSDNSTKTDYGWQDEFIAIGLNYIEKYYPLAKDYSKGKNITSLKNAIEKLNKNYQVLKDEYQSANKISDDEDMTIYNGFIAKYGEEARIFSGQVYDLAEQLSLYLSNQVKVDQSVGSEEMTQVAFKFYIDSRLLEIYNDYNDFLMFNCLASVEKMPSTIISLQTKEVASGKTPEEIEKIKNYFNALAGERELTQTALEKFSYYDYKITYNGDITAYQKKVPLAKAYLLQLQRYYLNATSYTARAYSYLTANIFA